ncbi:hypothetical protein ACHQM5_010379 [Ranunculus cassubicifolius]
MACTIDFRFLDEGLGGTRNKRKRIDDEDEDQQQQMDLDDNLPSSKRTALSSAENPDKPIFGKTTYDGVIAGKVSGRKWKQPRERRSSAGKVSLKGTPYELRKQQKEVKKAYQQRVNELKEEIRVNKVEKRKKKIEREKKKQENIMRSGSKLQVISNPKTLKKIAQSKKKNLLRNVPSDLLKKKK